MKKLLFIILFLPVLATAQKISDSPAYMLGDQKLKTRELQIHLDKVDPAAGILFRQHRNHSITAVVFSGVGLVSTIYAISQQSIKPEPNYSGAVTGYLVAAGAFSGSLIFTLTARAKERRAIDGYNSRH